MSRGSLTGARPDPCAFRPDAVLVTLSQHAVDRYQQRVRPALSAELAREDLGRLIGLGRVASEPPSWLADRQAQRAAFYLTVGDVVLPLDPDRRDTERLIALTCIARGGISEIARHARNQRRRMNAGDAMPRCEGSPALRAA
jgi:hypothetical protein